MALSGNRTWTILSARTCQQNAEENELFQKSAPDLDLGSGERHRSRALPLVFELSCHLITRNVPRFHMLPHVFGVVQYFDVVQEVDRLCNLVGTVGPDRNLVMDGTIFEILDIVDK